MSGGASRPGVSERAKIAVWAAAAGRCTFCNRTVLANDDLGEAVPIGELAHSVGWSDASPRGRSDLSAEDRRDEANLILACRNCHKPIDDGGVLGRFTVEELLKRKNQHETRVAFLTSIGADRKSTIIRIVGPVRGMQPALTYDHVLEATTAAGSYPQLLTGAHRNEVDLDLRHLRGEGTGSYFETCASQIDSLVERVNDGVRRDEIARLSVFGFARVPLLIHLGARLDDKIRTDIFQRQRVDDANAWRWPASPPPTPKFDFRPVHRDDDRGGVALVVSVSGTVPLDDIPEETGRSRVYVLSPDAPAEPGPTLISSPEALAAFTQVARRFLAHASPAA